MQIESFTQQLEKINERHKEVQQNLLQSKQQMVEHTNLLTTSLVDNLHQEQLALGFDKESRQALLAQGQ